MAEQVKKPQVPSREAGMMTNVGFQGVGKTYLNMHIIRDYVKDKISTRVKGSKVLIFDTNGEYTKEQFTENDVPNFDPKRIAVKDIPEWSRANIAECRRIDAKSVSIPQKKAILEYLIKHFRNGMLVVEDVNTYILNVTHMEEIVGGLVNLRHRAVDVMISYQRLRAVEPIILANSRWIRLHYQTDQIDDVKGKLSNPVMMSIANNLVTNRYFNDDQRFYVYVQNAKNKIEGQFTKKEFAYACKQFLYKNKKYIREHKEMNDIKTMEEAERSLINQYANQYYGNPR